jgi:hypothetical protein
MLAAACRRARSLMSAVDVKARRRPRVGSSSELTRRPVRQNREVIDLARLVGDFALGIERADKRRPQAPASRSDRTYRPGLGPHTEAQTIALVLKELVELDAMYSAHTVDVRYPDRPRQRCDWCLGTSPVWDWAIEAKLLRLFGDNGKPNDNMLTHVLSPYPDHRSALTDCDKLSASSLQGRKAILIFGYDYDGWEMAPAIDAFETLASRRVELGVRQVAGFSNLVHPVHTCGAVVAWEVAPRTLDGLDLPA